MLFAEDEDTPMPKQHAALKQQGVSPEVVSQQVLMQHAGQEFKPEAAASAGRADAAADDAALVYLLLHHTHTEVAALGLSALLALVQCTSHIDCMLQQ